MKTLTILTYILIFSLVSGSHFRGGTISWKQIKPDNQVEFRFKLSWAMGSSGCSKSSIGKLTSESQGSWSITNQCSRSCSISDVNYICSNVNQKEDWEVGERTFVHKFTTKGPYHISFSGVAWITLDYGRGGMWNVETSVNLNERSDTKTPNISPETSSRAIYRIQFGCPVRIMIPLADTDRDIVRCRWATNQEAASISRVLPNADLDEASCTIRFLATANNSYTSNGWFAVALTIEDFPRTNISVNERVYTSFTALSQVPLQFLIRTEIMSGACNEKPTFVPSSPEIGSILTLEASKPLHIRYYIHSNVSLVSIDINGLTGFSQSSINPDDRGRINVWFVDVSWTPKQSSQVTNIICSTAEDIKGKLSDTQCFTVILTQRTDFCQSFPCQHGGTCNNQLHGFSCVCPEPWFGDVCVNRDIKRPLESPNTICTDYLYGFLCHIICIFGTLLICVPCMACIFHCCQKNKVKPQLKSINDDSFETHTTRIRKVRQLW